METASVRIRFKATPELPAWRHKTSAIEQVPFGSGTTTRVRGPVVLDDAAVLDIEAWEAQWLTRHYPENFFVVGSSTNDPADPNFNVEACNYSQLQTVARKLGISPNGKEPALRAAVRAALAQNNESRKEDES